MGHTDYWQQWYDRLTAEQCCPLPTLQVMSCHLARTADSAFGNECRCGKSSQSHTFMKDLHSILTITTRWVWSTGDLCRATWSTPSTPSSLESLNVQTWLGRNKAWWYKDRFYKNNAWYKDRFYRNSEWYKDRFDWQLQVMLTHNLLVTGGKGFLTVRSLLASARRVDTLHFFHLVSFSWWLVFEDYSKVSKTLFANIWVF